MDWKGIKLTLTTEKGELISEYRFDDAKRSDCETRLEYGFFHLSIKPPSVPVEQPEVEVMPDEDAQPHQGTGEPVNGQDVH